MKVLIVDDDVQLAANLAAGLDRAGIEARAITDPAGRDLAGEVRGQDVLVLDVMLGSADGMEVSRGLRRAGVGTPILMLTARDAVADRVAGLESGADDYLVKPFALEELVARVRALVRRRPAQRAAVIEVAGLRFDVATGRLEVGGRAVRLTRREGMLLQRLLADIGQPVSQQQLHEQLWGGESPPTSNLVEVYVGRLRRKLADAGAGVVVLTLRSHGYLLEVADRAGVGAG